MRVCIFGAGAVGGVLGAQLAIAGTEVTLVARGENAARIKAEGIRVCGRAGTLVAHPRCLEDPREVGPQDVVFLTLKAPVAARVADQMTPLLTPKTTVVTAANGIPWWYFHDHAGELRDFRLASVDPDGRQWDAIGPERALGCVVYIASELEAPGVVRHIYGNRFVLGEPSGQASPRSRVIARTLIEAGLKAPVRPRIREEIWVKLWGNLAFNPISALTGATLEEMVNDTGTCAVAREMMIEGQTIAERLGIRFPVDIDARIDATRRVGPHKTSMLQDLERRRPLEIDALLGVIGELGRRIGVATPMCDAIYALTRRRAIEAGCYPG